MKSTIHIPGVLIVWITSFLFFLSTLANNFSASHDSIHYLLGIVSGDPPFHQHHLLYHVLAHKWLMLGRFLFPGISEPFLIESFTAVWGSSVLAMVYTIFQKRFFLTTARAAAGTALVACSYGVWFYSVNIEVYMPPLFFILCSLYLLTRPGLRRGDAWKLGVAHSLAILFHQVNILFTLVTLYTFYLHRENLRLTPMLVRYALTVALITGGGYFLAGWVAEGHDSVAAFTEWVLGYTIGHGYWQAPGWTTPLHVVAGFARAFIGGHFLFRVPALEALLSSSFHSHGLQDEAYLAEGISGALAWLLLLLTTVFAVLLLSLAIRVMSARHTVGGRPLLVRPLVCCLLVYSLFFCFWMPEILEFWILQSVLVWLLLVGMLPGVRLRPFRLPAFAELTVLALLLFSINYFGSLRWLGDPERDWYYRETLKISTVLSPEDLVVVEDEWILKDYLRYYTPARIIATDEAVYDTVSVQKIVRQTGLAGGKIYYYRRNTAGRGEFILSD